MKKLLPSLARGLVFCLLAALLLGYAGLVLNRRTVTGPWDYTRMIGGFFRNEPENSYDILAFGSSHMYCTLDPEALEQQTGLRSYVLATQQQPLPLTARYVEMALEKQSPRLIILEGFMLGRSDAALRDPGVMHDGLDPLPMGPGKVSAVCDLLPWGDRAEYLVPLVKYHERWREFDRSWLDLSWLRERDTDRGYVDLSGGTGAWCRQTEDTGVTPEPITDTDRAALDAIREAARRADCRLLILLSPYSEAQADAPRRVALARYAQQHGLDFLDMNACFDSLGLDNTQDFFDGDHFNHTGAAKAAAWLAPLLTDLTSGAQ